MRVFLMLAAGAVAAAGLAAPALAQTQTYLPRRLTSGDMRILQHEAAMLGPHGPKEAHWHNPESGNAGRVAFLGASTDHGAPCRTFRYTFRTNTPQDGRPYELKWCEMSPGNWRIAP